MQTVWINGSFVDPPGAVSAMDAGLLHAVGLFETMSGGVTGDTPHLRDLDRHLARLERSAEALALRGVETPALRGALLACVARAALPGVRVRLTITGGDLNLLAAPSASRGHTPRPTIIITAGEAPAYPEAMYRRGIASRIADARANPFNPFEGHKTLSYWWRLRELALASSVGAAEALIFSITNHLVGGAVSNAFLVRGDTLITPIARGEEERVGGKGAIPSATLPGIVRARVLEWAVDAGLEVRRRMISLDDVNDADELFLTNSGWGVLPVVRVERRDIRDGAVGPVTRRLIDSLVSLPAPARETAD